MSRIHNSRQRGNLNLSMSHEREKLEIKLSGTNLTWQPLHSSFLNVYGLCLIGCGHSVSDSLTFDAT